MGVGSARSKNNRGRHRRLRKRASYIRLGKLSRRVDAHVGKMASSRIGQKFLLFWEAKLNKIDATNGHEARRQTTALIASRREERRRKVHERALSGR